MGKESSWALRRKVNRWLILWNPKRPVSPLMFSVGVLYQSWPGVHVSARCAVSVVYTNVEESGVPRCSWHTGAPEVHWWLVGVSVKLSDGLPVSDDFQNWCIWRLDFFKGERSVVCLALEVFGAGGINSPRLFRIWNSWRGWLST